VVSNKVFFSHVPFGPFFQGAFFVSGERSPKHRMRIESQTKAAEKKRKVYNKLIEVTNCELDQDELKKD
jgi:hypothetical protein